MLLFPCVSALPRTLVVLYGNQRGGPLAWESMNKYLIRPLEADVAVLFPTRGFPVSVKFDWSSIRAPLPSFSTWKRLCGLKYQSTPEHPVLFGQTMGLLCPDHLGSAGLLLVDRWRAQIGISKLLDEYDRFIFTRSDYLYLAEHPPLEEDEEGPYFLAGEEYGGVSDRHTIGSNKNTMRVLNVTQDLLYRPKVWEPKMEQQRIVNLEQLLSLYFQEQDIKFGKIEPVMFTVRAKGDGTSWSVGDIVPPFDEFGLLVKYPTELERVRVNIKTGTMETERKTLLHMSSSRATVGDGGRSTA